MAPFDVEYDLVVVGSGASGKSAALIAARAGKSVVILEKMEETGGLSMFAEGTCAFESTEQKERKVPVNPNYHFPTKQEGYDKFNHYSHYRAHGDVVRAFVDNSAEIIDIYRDLGVKYKNVWIAALDDPNELVTFHLAEGLGAHCQEVLLSAVEKEGVDIFTSTPAQELIQDADGQVIGVIAESGGEPLRVGGKAVVLATGGMGSNPDLLAKHSWFYESAHNMDTVTPLQNNGDGLQMALAAGADPRSIITCPLLGVIARGTAMDSHTSAAGDQPNVWVNKLGKRFVSEDKAENIGDIGPLWGKQPNGEVYSILCEDDIDRLMTEGSEISIGEFVVAGRPLDRLRTEIDQNVADGITCKADTPEDLAKQIGIDPQMFAQTIADYNRYCETGIDEAYFKKARYLRKLTPPFYAIDMAVVTMGSSGGIRINENMQVITAQGTPILGLYAVGLDATGLYGDSYNMEVPGASNGFAHTSGILAARHAVSTMA